MERPNILLLLTDQQRWDSLGCYGADWIETPALDSIARDGVRFDRCYCTNPICTPSRASLWTGRHLPGHGVYRLDDILPSDQVMFTEHLQEAGYRTGLFGKLHVSGRRYEDEHRHPHDGFDEYEWALEGPLNMDAPMQAYARWLKRNDPDTYETMHEMGRDLHHIPRELHFTHWAFERGRDFVRRTAGKQPIFCCISVFDPHNPYEDHPLEYRGRVDVTKLPPVIDDRRTDVPWGVERERKGSYLGDIDQFTEVDIEEIRRGYYASICLLDDEVGETLRLLEELGINESTLVILASDHGDMLGDHRLFVKGAMFYDASVRVPLIVRWPGEVPSGAAITSPVQPHDIATTILRAAGIEPAYEPGEAELAGRDLLPLMRGECESVHDEIFCLYRNTGINRHTRDWDPPIHASMVFDGRYKLSIFHDDEANAFDARSGRRDVDGRPPGELYDLHRDPDELANLWGDDSAIAVKERLMLRLLGWLAANEVSYLGSRGGTAVVPPEQYVANTIDRSRGTLHV
jgi:arylsulfatase A-like enzyme